MLTSVREQLAKLTAERDELAGYRDNCGPRLIEATDRIAELEDERDAAVVQGLEIIGPFLEKAAQHGKCNAYDMGKFVGCETYHSSDPNEYCLPCEARAIAEEIAKRKAAG
jgi:hypothetical protein